MSRIGKILCGLACAFVFCFLAIGYAAVQDELSVNGSVSVRGDAYRLIYHTYDAAGNDVVYKTDVCSSVSDTLTIAACPGDKTASQFFGWTFSGVYTNSFTSNAAIYTGGEKVTFSTLQSNQGTTGKEVHLYDVYTTSPSLTAKQHPQDTIVGPVANNAQTPFTFKSKVTNSAGTKEFEIKTSGNAAVNFVSRKDGKTVVLYYHPGVQVMVNGGTVSGATAYVTKNSGDKTSKVTSYEALPASGNTVRYVGVDFTPSNTCVVYYHSYDGNGDFVYDYVEYFGESSTVTFIARPNNSYTNSKTWRCWALTGVVAATEADNVSEYAPNGTAAFSTLHSAQSFSTTIDGVSVKCVRMFDIYASTAKIIAKPLSGNEVTVQYNIGIGSAYGSLPYCRPSGGGNWTLATNSSGITFYYHPGIILSSQTGPGNNGEDVWQSLNSSPHQASGYEWVGNADGSAGGRINTSNNGSGNLTITSYYTQNVTLKYDGEIVIYDASDEPAPSGGGDCFAPGTLITLADGSQVPVEQLTGNETILAFDHETGQFVPAKLLIAQNRGEKFWSTMELKFSDGTALTIMNERALFDITLNRYVWINKNNLTDFIGHEFAKQAENGDGFVRVVLVHASEEERFTACYSVVSIYHFNCFGNGMMSLPGSVEGLFNYFEYGEGLKYDEAKKQADIEKYGLFEAKDFAEELDEVLFEQMFPVKYMKIAIGKGNITREEILRIIAIWVDGENLLDKFPAN